MAWAPGKGMKGKEFKDYWEVELGSSYIPHSKLADDVDLDLLEEGGMIDDDTVPEKLQGMGWEYCIIVCLFTYIIIHFRIAQNQDQRA